MDLPTPHFDPLLPSATDPVRYVVLGAGAVGAAVGGMLALIGARVVFIARGANLEALRSRGLTVSTPSRRFQLVPPAAARGDETATAVEAVGSPRDVRFTSGDVILLATKSQHSEQAIAELAASAPRTTPIVCLQNGVANEERASARFEWVHGAVVFMPASHLEPGKVTIHSEPILGGIDVGCHPRGADAVDARLAFDLVQGGFDARVEPDIARWKYAKLLTNLGNAVQALSGDDGLRGSLCERLEAEARACFAAARIDSASSREIRERHARILDLEVEGARRVGGSTWQSLSRQTGDVETDDLNGEIVRLGKRYGVPTPLNAALATLSQRAAREKWAPGALTPDELEALLRSSG